jgi:hypothetical protein
MSDNWGYVIAGYAITGATLIGYAVSVRIRTRRARRLLAKDSGD